MNQVNNFRSNQTGRSNFKYIYRNTASLIFSDSDENSVSRRRQGTGKGGTKGKIKQSTKMKAGQNVRVKTF